MRVALVCPYGLDAPGGVQGQVLGLARALRAEGAAVLVVAPGRGDAPGGAGAPAEAAGAPGSGAAGAPGAGEGGATGSRSAGATEGAAGAGTVLVGRTVPVPANGSVAPLALGPGALARTVRVLRRFGPGVVHLHEPLAPGPTWAALAAPLPGARRVATLHRAGGAGLYRALGPVARAAMRRIDAVFAVSEEARATAAAALGGRPCPVVGNGVELDRFRSAPAAATAGPTVLFVGRHEPRKGLAVLLQAVEQLGDDWPGRLWIVGEGPQTAELRRRYPPGPGRRWLGRVGDAELAGLMAGSHVLCAPSQGGESFGVVLLEAMAARSVVVCSDIPGYAAAAGGHAVLVPPGDAAALAGSLRDAVGAVGTGSGAASAAALAAASAHAERHSMDALARRYLAAYGGLAPAGGPGG